jgi:hypothetical protein
MSPFECEGGAAFTRGDAVPRVVFSPSFVGRRFRLRQVRDDVAQVASDAAAGATVRAGTDRATRHGMIHARTTIANAARVSFSGNAVDRYAEIANKQNARTNKITRSV